MRRRLIAPERASDVVFVAGSPEADAINGTVVLVVAVYASSK